jgi:hypothetical protein
MVIAMVVAMSVEMIDEYLGINIGQLPPMVIVL